MYSYQKEKSEIFTEGGQKMFLGIRDNTQRLLKQAGAARVKEVIKGQSGSSWTMLACIDRLVELGEIKEITGPNVAGQHRVFISA